MLAASRPSNTLVYLRDGSAQTILLEIEVADQSFYLTQSQYTDTVPTSPSTDPIMPGAWQGSHWSANFLSYWYDSTRKKISSQAGFEPGNFRSQGRRLNHKASEAVSIEDRAERIKAPLSQTMHRLDTSKTNIYALS